MLRSLKQAVVLAGGRGSRLKPITDKIPKALFEFHGKPFLGYLLEMLRDQGFQSVLLLLGYRAEQIRDYAGNGSEWGLDIEYSISSADNQTGTRLKLAEEQIEAQFLLMYCDNYWPMNIQSMLLSLEGKPVSNSVTVYNNSDNYTKSNLRVSDDGIVTHYDKSRQDPDLNGVDIGYFVLEKTVIDLIPEGNVSFERSAMQELIQQRKLAAFQTDHRYYSVGDHKRLPLTDAFLKREPTIILDRDGVLNEKAAQGEYVCTWGDFEWLPDSREALIALKLAGYRILLITNQAGIARGVMTIADLESLHSALKDNLKQSGASIDKIYFCPHHWDEDCSCRKPKPGMLFQAQRDYHLDLSRTYFIGDDDRDGEAADAAGAPFIHFKAGDSLLESVKNAGLI